MTGLQDLSKAALGVLFLTFLLGIGALVLITTQGTMGNCTVQVIRETQVNESNSLLNASGEDCALCWTSNYTRNRWVSDTVILSNTTETVNRSWYNVSYPDSAISLNGTAAEVANGTYNTSYDYTLPATQIFCTQNSSTDRDFEAYQIAGQGVTGIGQFGNWLVIIVIVILAGIVIAFMVKGFGQGGA